MLKRGFVLGCLLLAQPALAATWLEAGRDRSRVVLVDAASVQWRGDFATFWARFQPQAGAPGVNGQYVIQLSCGMREIRVSMMPGTSMADNPLGQGNASPFTFQPAVGFAANLLLSRVCAMRPQPAQKADFAIAARDTGPKVPIRPQGRIPGPTLDH